MAIATATVIDDTGSYTGSLDLIARNAIAAMEAWMRVLAPSVGSIQIEVRLVAPRADYLATGGPVDGIFAGKDILESGAAFELLSGIDLDPDAPDIVIELDADFADSRVHIDTFDGTPIGFGKVSLVSVLAHEIGHGLGIVGFRDEETYEPDPEAEGVQSTFDIFIEIIDGAPFFTGDNAKAVYGGNVPLSRGHLYHIGNDTGAGTDLVRDLMFWAASPGAPMPSRLDAAMLSDMGLATIFDDTIAGSTQADTMNGGAGDDIIFSFSRDDSVSGAEGDDYLRGGDGNDQLVGGPGFDDLNGNAGDDTASGGLGPDWVVGGRENDRLNGDESADIVYGNLGNDTCDGGADADLVRGGQGDDLLFGGAGDDWLSGDRDADTLTGGSGADIFHSFGDAGIDRVTDFNRAEGDRVLLDPGTVYTVSQSGADVVVAMTGGGQVILVGVQQSTLTGDWIFGA